MIKIQNTQWKERGLPFIMVIESDNSVTQLLQIVATFFKYCRIKFKNITFKTSTSNIKVIRIRNINLSESHQSKDIRSVPYRKIRRERE